MSKSKSKIVDRILAAALSLILTVGFMPVSVFAEPVVSDTESADLLNAEHKIKVNFGEKCDEVQFKINGEIVEISDNDEDENSKSFTAENDDRVNIILKASEGYQIEFVKINAFENDNAITYDESYEGFNSINFEVPELKITDEMLNEINVEVDFKAAEETTTEPLIQTTEPVIETTATAITTATITSITTESTGTATESIGTTTESTGTTTESTGTTTSSTTMSSTTTTTTNESIETTTTTTEPTTIELSLEGEGNGDKNVYHSDVKVKVTVNIPGDYAKIKTIEYWITCDGKKTEHEELKLAEGAYSFTVSAANYNSKDVEVKVKVTDTSGTKKSESKTLSINATPPTIESVTIDGTTAVGAEKGYYNSKRTATVVIKDRDDTFDENGFDILDVNSNQSIINSEEITWEKNDQEGKYKASFTFKEDGTYNWKPSYTNLAGKCNEKLPEAVDDSTYHFIIDTEPPTGKITYPEKNPWTEVRDTITFGIFDKKEITIKVSDASDETSDIKEIVYYKKTYTDNLKDYQVEQDAVKDDLERLYDFDKSAWSEAPVTISENEKAVVYARIMDNAGNVTYIGTDGLIVDNKEPLITIENKTTPVTGNTYNCDVTFNVEVNETVEGNEAFSGINKVYYVVKKGNEVLTRKELFNWISKSENAKLVTALPEENSSFTLKAEDFNYDNLSVEVHVVDNAENEQIAESDSFNIDIDEPSVSLEYNNNSALNDSYFTSREAYLTIKNTRANDQFDENAATAAIQIEADNLNGKPTKDKPLYNVTWGMEGNNHKATIKFNYDGRYTWKAFNYTNTLGNTTNSISADGQIAPFVFTIDKTPPTGSITISENTWDKVVETLTFGLYSKESFDVSAEAHDITSPVKIEYYKTDKTTAMDYNDLVKITHWETYDKAFKISKPEKFVIYLKLIDYAGNYTYISSDGHIIDNEPCTIEFIPEMSAAYINGTAVYNAKYKKVNVGVIVEDKGTSSGIKTVNYWVEKDGEKIKEGTLFKFDKESLKYEDLVFSVPGEDIPRQDISVDTASTNSCNVIVHVEVEDNAGNKSENAVQLDIDITAPTIEVTYDNNSDNAGNGYFDKTRTATVAITERTHHFDPDDVDIRITAADANGDPVNDAYNISNWSTLKGATPDQDVHTATISYNADANYTFDISYTDKAGNKAGKPDTKNSASPYKFTVDTNPPTGTITAASAEGRVEEWDGLISSLNFGFWSNNNINISGTSSDKTSPIASVEYYKTSAVDPLSESELKSVKDWKVFNGFDVTPNEQFTVYLKITDMAGNVAYISTNGLIVDNTSPREEVTAPDITVTPQQTKSGIYSGDVTVSITADDPLVGDTYSGLRTVSYRVLNMGTETQSGTLYSFDNAAPKQGDLQKSWSGQITVDSSLNNSNDVVIEVYAEDNSLNSSTESISVKIDTTAPTISISYDNNSQDSDNAGYFKDSRTATIVIAERNFDPDEVALTITNEHGAVPTISDWTTSGGTGNGDDILHTATLTYSEDGDYKFAINCIDLAGNSSDEAQFTSGTVAATEFTIDVTMPVINVSYSNNSAENDIYFKAGRTATITINEHNFDASRVKVTITATLDGKTIEAPTVSGWTSSGDVHTATVTFKEDGDYTFKIEFTDMAGNQNNGVSYGTSVASEKFTVDTTIVKPEISGVKNGEAYKGDVVPVIAFFDTNIDSYTYQLLRTRKDEKDVDVTKQFMKDIKKNGYSYSGIYDTFEKIQDNDGIYTLIVTVTDKAGNTETQKVTFSVNRFGSVYVFNDYLISLQDTYNQAIDGQIVIKEYNPDKLVEDSLKIDITCDSTPLTDVKYTSSPELNSVTGTGSSGWYEYSYIIAPENFEHDGIYKIIVSSKDEAGNNSETSNYDDKAVLFRVDTTAPELTNVTGLESRTINANSVDVGFEAFDAIGLEKITVYVDDKEVAVFNNFENMINTSGTFQLTEGINQNIRFVIVDKAGNETDTSDAAFKPAYKFEQVVTISTNFFIRWYSNTALFWGTIIGSVILIAGIVLLIVKRRRSN